MSASVAETHDGSDGLVTPRDVDPDILLSFLATGYYIDANSPAVSPLAPVEFTAEAFHALNLEREWRHDSLRMALLLLHRKSLLDFGNVFVSPHLTTRGDDTVFPCAEGTEIYFAVAVLRGRDTSEADDDYQHMVAGQSEPTVTVAYEFNKMKQTVDCFHSGHLETVSLEWTACKILRGLQWGEVALSDSSRTSEEYLLRNKELQDYKEIPNISGPAVIYELWHKWQLQKISDEEMPRISPEHVRKQVVEWLRAWVDEALPYAVSAHPNWVARRCLTRLFCTLTTNDFTYFKQQEYCACGFGYCREEVVVVCPLCLKREHFECWLKYMKGKEAIPENENAPDMRGCEICCMNCGKTQEYVGIVDLRSGETQGNVTWSRIIQPRKHYPPDTSNHEGLYGRRLARSEERRLTVRSLWNFAEVGTVWAQHPDIGCWSEDFGATEYAAADSQVQNSRSLFPEVQADLSQEVPAQLPIGHIIHADPSRSSSRRQRGRDLVEDTRPRQRPRRMSPDAQGGAAQVDWGHVPVMLSAEDNLALGVRNVGGDVANDDSTVSSFRQCAKCFHIGRADTYCLACGENSGAVYTDRVVWCQVREAARVTVYNGVEVPPTMGRCFRCNKFGKFGAACSHCAVYGDTYWYNACTGYYSADANVSQYYGVNQHCSDGEVGNDGAGADSSKDDEDDEDDLVGGMFCDSPGSDEDDDYEDGVAEMKDHDPSDSDDDVAAAEGANSHIGTCVAKMFESQWYEGKVRECLQDSTTNSKFFNVIYNDGDSEDVSEAELKELEANYVGLEVAKASGDADDDPSQGMMLQAQHGLVKRALGWLQGFWF